MARNSMLLKRTLSTIFTIFAQTMLVDAKTPLEKKRERTKHIAVIYWHEFQLEFNLLKWVNWIRSLNHCYHNPRLMGFFPFFLSARFEQHRHVYISVRFQSPFVYCNIFIDSLLCRDKSYAHAVALCDNEFAFHIYSQPIYSIYCTHVFTMHQCNRFRFSSCVIHFCYDFWLCNLKKKNYKNLHILEWVDWAYTWIECAQYVSELEFWLILKKIEEMAMVDTNNLTIAHQIYVLTAVYFKRFISQFFPYMQMNSNQESVTFSYSPYLTCINKIPVESTLDNSILSSCPFSHFTHFYHSHFANFFPQFFGAWKKVSSEMKKKMCSHWKL